MITRILATTALLASFVPATAADTYSLAESLKPGDAFRVKLSMKLAGQMRFQRADGPNPMQLKAEAEHDFTERVLAVGKAGDAEKSARLYQSAKAQIEVGRFRSARSLRADRKLVVAQRHEDQSLVYCPAGALYQSELELTSEHLDTLPLTGLLPGKEVAAGETWKVGSGVAQGLCHFEGLTEQNLICKLEDVTDKVARVSVSGTAGGIDVGAMAKLTIKAMYRFDLTSKRIVAIEWKQTDEREQGPASPASSVEMTTTLTREPVTIPTELADAAVASFPAGFTPPPAMTQLDLQDADGRYDLLYAREWHIVSQTERQLVMRFMERGDFVTQVTITPWTPAARGQHLSAEEFRQAMARTPGWEVDRELQAGEVPADKGKYIYRLSQQGKLDGLEVMQNFFLVANEDGRQVVLAFTLSPKQAERLGARDLSLVGSLDFPAKK